MTRVLLGAVVALGLLAVPLPAQQQPDDLARMLDTLTRVWARGDADALGRLGASDGLQLEVHGDPMGPLSGRRATAALRQLFSEQETVTVRPGSPSRVAGASTQAFVELAWVIRPTGAPVRELNTVFIGFVRERSGWKISQIRILP